VDLNQDRGRQGVEVEELDRLGDDVFHPPAAGIIADQDLCRGIEVIGDQESRFLPSVAPENDLVLFPTQSV
jgi:hypothetical protein